MIQYGDIQTLNGRELPVVDVITGGSPCQDLSIAGLRKGLEGERSGLFMEQIRIVKEMRERDRQLGRTGYLIRPRFVVWENVEGAYSSNKGADFQAVLTEFAKIADPEAPDVPLPDKGRWPKSGCIYSDMGAWSIAWRLHDAQYWGAAQFVDGRMRVRGTPQRRKRIALVADLGGLAAPEILFERKGMRWNPSESEETRKDAPRAATGSVGETGRGSWRRPDTGDVITITGKQQSLATQTEVAGAIGANDYKEPQAVCIPIHDQATRYQGKHGDKHDGKGNGLGVGNDGDPANTLSSSERHAVLCLNDQGGNNMEMSDGITGTLRAQDHGHPPLVFDGRGRGDGQIAPTMCSDHFGRPSDYTALCIGNGQLNQISMEPVANTLDTMHDQQAIMTATGDTVAPSLVASVYKGPGNTQDGACVLVYGIDRAAYNQGENAQFDFRVEEEKIGAQTSREPGAVFDYPVVRRLTPTECERLQGFPDGWTDIGDWVDLKGKNRKAADAQRYKALGNSIALPFWQYLARRICAQYEREITMGSLFDGIGGFPLVFSRCGAIPVWSSEIDEFCIAVTKKHFNGEEP